jgi:hypothetical protein
MEFFPLIKSMSNNPRLLLKGIDIKKKDAQKDVFLCVLRRETALHIVHCLKGASISTYAN